MVRKIDKKKICTKYLCVFIDEQLLFKDHINFLKQKLNTANSILAKLRPYLPSDILKTVYSSHFDTHLRHARLNSSLPAIFDDLFKPFKEQHSHNTRGARRYVLNIPKMKTSFYGSRSVQVKSIKDWNNIIDKIDFTAEYFMKCFEVIKKMKNTLQ